MRQTTIRRLVDSDLESASSIANAVVQELYGHLIGNSKYEINRLWAVQTGLVALEDGIIVGVGITDQASINDLWLLPGCRRRGIGSSLLAALEAQIFQNGYFNANLRVVAENKAARRFYSSCGWHELQTYDHEKWGFPMVDFLKGPNVTLRPMREFEL
jgi:ribosomal protein S18 acetylase RimI-like enzyme